MSDATALIARLQRFFEDRPEDVAAVYLFGSMARGTATASSDIDVAVLLATDPAAPCDLVHRVLRDGHLVLDRRPSARVAFEVRSRNEFFDLEPILRQYRGAGAGTTRR